MSPEDQQSWRERPFATSVWDDEAQWLDLRSVRLVNFVLRHPNLTMPIVSLLTRLKYWRRRRRRRRQHRHA